jgi:flagellin
MPSIINTNISSLNAQRNLDASQALLSTSLQRLSSGLRINSAKDDAAGLAISQRFTAQINGLDQAARNANDAISLAQTADGSLSTITDNLQRIRQLAVQSANGTNSATDRAALNTEVSQLKSEIDRTAGSASFNGVQLLDGSNPSFVFQVGANTTANDTITVSGLVNATTSGLGSVTTATTQSSVISGFTTTAIAGNGTDYVTINGTNIGAIAATGTSSQRAAQIAAAVNAISTTTGVNAYVDSTSGKLTLTSTGNITITSGGTGATGSGLAAGSSATASTVTGLTTLDVSSYSGAQLAINQVDSALSQINSARATLGAVENRFSSVVTNVQTTDENLTASRSRIQDADFAAETANLTKAQILQQAGTAILAQANSIPNNVLTLLK